MSSPPPGCAVLAVVAVDAVGVHQQHPTGPARRDADLVHDLDRRRVERRTSPASRSRVARSSSSPNSGNALVEQCRPHRTPTRGSSMQHPDTQSTSRSVARSHPSQVVAARESVAGHDRARGTRGPRRRPRSGTGVRSDRRRRRSCGPAGPRCRRAGATARPRRSRRACPSTIRCRGSAGARTARRSPGCPGSTQARGTRSSGFSIRRAHGCAATAARVASRRARRCRSPARRCRCRRDALPGTRGTVRGSPPVLKLTMTTASSAAPGSVVMSAASAPPARCRP